MIHVDGARGEGGGQVLRTALALATATRRDVRVTNVRANRPEPGLRPQHVASVNALAALADARVDGVAVGSTDVTYRPGVMVGGAHEVAIGTAGSLTVLLQTLLPAMAASRQSFELTLEGGTDVPFAPTWDYFARVHAPLLGRMGVGVETVLERRGYFPAGGGRARVTVDAGGFRAADLVDRGAVRLVAGRAHAHALPREVVGRGAEALRDRLTRGGLAVKDVEVEQHRGPGVGFGLAAWAECERSVLGADGIGRRGVRAEDVAARAAKRLLLALASGAALDEHQADQMPVFIALAGGGSFTATHLTPHAETVLGMLGEFLPVHVERAAAGSGVRVDIQRR